MTRFFLVHLAVTWMLVGLIWVVQILAYPQFRRVGRAEFQAFHFAHCLRIGLVIAPLILVEAGSAGWLLYQGCREPLFLISMGVLLMVWLSTAIVQAPLHTRLMKGFDEARIQRLIRTNWVRTLAWTARGILVGCSFATLAR